jgi:hypothetical protein
LLLLLYFFPSILGSVDNYFPALKVRNILVVIISFPLVNLRHVVVFLKLNSSPIRLSHCLWRRW